MIAFYRERFANAADFTFFMVGAFKVDEVAAAARALRRRRCRRPGKPTSQLQGRRRSTFPTATERAKVEKGREPRGQTVISFFADPPPIRSSRSSVIAATTVLDIALRDILREELGQTYTVAVGLSQPLPQRGGGHIQVRFGAAPENIATMTERVLQEIKRLQQEGPSPI